MTLNSVLSSLIFVVHNLNIKYFIGALKNPSLPDTGAYSQISSSGGNYMGIFTDHLNYLCTFTKQKHRWKYKLTINKSILILFYLEKKVLQPKYSNQRELTRSARINKLVNSR